MRKWQFAVMLSGVAALAAVAAWVSYWHTVEVASRAGEAVLTAHLIPITADGLMAVSGQLMWTQRVGRKWPARVAFGLGAAAMLGSNWMAAGASWLSHVVALWPAVALVAAMMVLETAGVRVPRKATRRAPAKAPQRARVAVKAATDPKPRAPRTRARKPVQPAVAPSPLWVPGTA